jgi:DNA-binding NtrC family response regulator
MPGPSPASRSSSIRKMHSSSFERSASLELSADQTEAVRRLVGHTIAQVECELIIETLINQDCSRTNSARLLGISIRTLRNKIHEYRARGKIVPEPWAH